MATYFVRKTGNDTNDGLSAGAAFLTIDKAANTVAAGDVVYIGSGVYRELVTMDTPGTAEAQISFIADVTGAYTGDAGLVIISAFDTDTDAPARNNCLNWNGKLFITWRGVTFTGGLQDVIVSDNGNTNYEGCLLEDCAVIGYATNVNTIWLDTNAPGSGGGTPATTGFTFRRCVIWGQTAIAYVEVSGVTVDLKILFENCIFCGVGRETNNAAINFWNGYPYYPNPTGGLTIQHCTFLGGHKGVFTSEPQSGTPTTVTNCLFIGISATAIERSGGNLDAVVSDYNRFVYCAVPHQYVTAGANDDSTGDFGMLGGIADWPLYRFWGWSPFLPYEPVSGISGYTNPLVGAATGTATEDAYGNPRPMGRNTRDIGAVEARTRPADETTTVHGGSHAAKFSGAGFYECFVPVPASETTISAYAYKDANYTGDAPIMEIYNIPGVADQSDAMAGAAEAWEQLSCTFTPTSAGLVRVRFRSRDESATGECIFDDLTVA